MCQCMYIVYSVGGVYPTHMRRWPPFTSLDQMLRSPSTGRMGKLGARLSVWVCGPCRLPRGLPGGTRLPAPSAGMEADRPCWDVPAAMSDMVTQSSNSWATCARIHSGGQSWQQKTIYCGGNKESKCCNGAMYNDVADVLEVYTCVGRCTSSPFCIPLDKRGSSYRFGYKHGCFGLQGQGNCITGPGIDASLTPIRQFQYNACVKGGSNHACDQDTLYNSTRCLLV